MSPPAQPAETTLADVPGSLLATAARYLEGGDWVPGDDATTAWKDTAWSVSPKAGAAFWPKAACAVLPKGCRRYSGEELRAEIARRATPAFDLSEVEGWAVRAAEALSRDSYEDTSREYANSTQTWAVVGNGAGRPVEIRRIKGPYAAREFTADELRAELAKRAAVAAWTEPKLCGGKHGDIGCALPAGHAEPNCAGPADAAGRRMYWLGPNAFRRGFGDYVGADGESGAPKFSKGTWVLPVALPTETHPKEASDVADADVVIRARVDLRDGKGNAIGWKELQDMTKPSDGFVASAVDALKTDAADAAVRSGARQLTRLAVEPVAALLERHAVDDSTRAMVAGFLRTDAGKMLLRAALGGLIPLVPGAPPVAHAIARELRVSALADGADALLDAVTDPVLALIRQVVADNPALTVAPAALPDATPVAVLPRVKVAAGEGER